MKKEGKRGVMRQLTPEELKNLKEIAALTPIQKKNSRRDAICLNLPRRLSDS